MRRIAIIAVAVFVALAASVPLALAQGTYTQIDFPGAFNSTATGIDAAGDIVGYYYNGGISGFLLKQGTYTTISYPASRYNYLYGINDAGTKVVGLTDSPALIGYVYSVPSQTYSPVVFPGADYTLPFGVNNAGTVIGTIAIDAEYLGFELPASGGGTVIAVDADVRNYTHTTGISNQGVVLGYTESGIVFAFYQDKYLMITGPDVSNFRILGINPQGTVLVGRYTLPSGISAGFVYQLGFMHQKKTFTTLEFPGSIGTEANGINRAGDVVGDFGDASRTGHGFLWTQPADPAKK